MSRDKSQNNNFNPKNNILRANDAYIAEHTLDAKKWFNMNRIIIKDIIFSTRKLTPEMYRNYINSNDNLAASDIKSFIGMSIELTKLYTAISYAYLCEDAINSGLSVMDSEDLKKKALIDLSQANSIDEFMEITINLSIAYNHLYHEQIKSNYSYCTMQAIEFIKQHRLAPCTSSTVADGIDVNQSYLSNLFHKETGYTLTEFIQNEKMNMAQELINRRLYSLNEISSLLGYENYSHFSRIFKKHFGITPSKFMN